MKAPSTTSTDIADRRDWIIAAALVLLVAALYWPVRHFDFVALDDGSYVTENAHVLGGLTLENVWWALTSVHRGYWIPLTWWSYMVDASVGGGSAGPFHVTNIALHALNAAMVFWVLRSMTGARWPSAIVAALFAVHPLHVESVAWITERKDVLSTFLMLVAIDAYVQFTRSRSRGAYAALLAAFLLSLLAKPITVTLPVVLLLIDAWPLDRLRAIKPASPRAKTPASASSSLIDIWRPLIVEKLPLFAIAGVFGVLTVLTQRGAGAIADLTALPLVPRVMYAVVGVAAYLLRAVWPTGLAAMYAFPQPLSGEWIVVSIAVLAAATVIAWRLRRAQPFIVVGWAWYLITLLPVSGLLQAGKQWTADRFVYVPLIGIWIAVVWIAAALVDKQPRLRVPAGAIAVALIAAFSTVSRQQLYAWTGPAALWEQVLTIGPRGDGVRARVVLGQMARDRGDFDTAARHFQALKDDFHTEDGTALVAKVKVDQAAAAAKAGRVDDAVRFYREAIALVPWAVDVHNDLAALLGNAHRDAEALAEFAAAADLEPRNADILTNYAIALARGGQEAEARTVFERILVIDPQHELARRALGRRD